MKNLIVVLFIGAWVGTVLGILWIPPVVEQGIFSKETQSKIYQVGEDVYRIEYQGTVNEKFINSSN